MVLAAAAAATSAAALVGTAAVVGTAARVGTQAGTTARAGTAVVAGTAAVAGMAVLAGTAAVVGSDPLVCTAAAAGRRRKRPMALVQCGPGARLHMAAKAEMARAVEVTMAEVRAEEQWMSR